MTHIIKITQKGANQLLMQINEKTYNNEFQFIIMKIFEKHISTNLQKVFL